MGETRGQLIYRSKAPRKKLIKLDKILMQNQPTTDRNVRLTETSYKNHRKNIDSKDHEW